jgi:NADPH2:quinone reductase
MELDLMSLMVKRIRIGASTLRFRSRHEKADVATAVAAHVVPALAAGRLSVPVCDTFPLAEAEAAYERFGQGSKLGKVVLVT